MSALPDFSLLSPQDVADAAEAVLGAGVSGELAAFPSYINRVYGLRMDDGRRMVAKFYRPGRWPEAALREELAFVADCTAAGLPVLAPLPDADGETLHAVAVEAPDGSEERLYYFSLYPFARGRGWEPRDAEGWLSLGRLVAALHEVGSRRRFGARTTIGGAGTGQPALSRLLESGAVHPDLRAEFGDLCAAVLEATAPLFGHREQTRLHGDLHRGNIIETETGPLLIDFDDAATGPAIQDLWLFLPGRLAESRPELNLLLEGYGEVRPFDYAETALVEPLRFLRMLWYLDWQARQRKDDGFFRAFPDWGNRAFWIKELEDFRDQARVIEGGEGSI
jgi:Ser/Thr protein kinase RdoA (MazF antagonist)